MNAKTGNAKTGRAEFAGFVSSVDSEHLEENPSAGAGEALEDEPILQ
jgi:hypothetical protein